MKHSWAPTRESLVERFGDRYAWLALLVVAFGTVAAVLSTTSFNVAIPALVAHFGLGQERIQWSITGFMGAMTVAMLPTPWLLERFGFRRCFLAAIAVLAAASVAGSLSPSIGFMVTMRVVQGLAAGLLQPLGTLAVLRLFPAHRQGKASGILGFGIILAPAVAPALGGLLLDHYGWPAIFWINLPFCLVAGVAALYLLPVAGERTPRPFDWPGVGMLAVATVCTIESVSSLHHSGLGSPWTWLPAAGAVAGFACFVRHSMRTPAPVVHPELFADRPFAMGSIVSFAYGFGFYASTYLIPVFMQTALGYSATQAGAILLPAGLVLAVCMPLAGHLADRHHPQRVTLTGLAVFGVSFVLLAIFGGGIAHGELIAVTVLGRVGLGLILPSLNLAALRGLAPHQLGQSSAVITYARQLGGVMGVAVAAVFVEWQASVLDPGTALATAFARSFLMLAAVLAAAFVAGCLMRHPSANKDRAG
ncbi:DHA2 family efflux MFS transporter permease subunit [Pseudothauera rhizosphaerae]|uniref:DHA2 family efflux MFS transporter permease subunit n=1 Tax=Pseudothauera rhizosphaerae TaxID=2565932 RepID=UPI001E44ECE0|nr:DHA2 family efflux MFS transporter permease subunit [Pseudothauera rhizosphaerae]